VADDITQWLEELSLGRYAQAFAENDIDFRALPHLSDDDLNELGLSLGHRRILQGALKEQQETGQPAATQAARDIAQAGTTPEAERRQLTVLFCDLVGSTALSSRLDPEDYREVIRAYQDACAGVITHYDGYVAKFMGDGVLAYFGWPRGHEDDAGRALSAGLGVVEAVSDIAPADGETEPLAVRIGIATGPVVVGDIVGEGAAQEAAVTGETPNLAARLQEIAEPNTIVIAATTHALAGGLFACETLGGQSLKGIDGSTEVWRVIGERLVESRFAAAHTAALTPLIGRDEELELLSRRWERAKGGDGQVVLLSGEPGIGKSRLTRALQDWIGDEPHTRLLYQCSPHHTSSALYPIINQLEIAAQFETGDDANARLDKLEALLAQSGQPTNEAIPLIAALLSIPAGEHHPLPELTPQRQKDRTLTALVNQLVGLAVQQPVLFVFEDAHWIDPTSLELLELIIERVRDVSVLILVTYRPEFTAPWIGLPHVTLQALNRLTPQDCTRMAEQLIGERNLSPEILTQIAERTDGVPLFIEELTRSVVESGFADNGADGDATANIVIPATLQDALEARLDKSPATRTVAQFGAAIGREFPYDLLAGVVSLSTADLNAALEDLADSGLIFARGAPPDASYTFKHALVQDTAYDSMVRSKRKDTHTRIVKSLIELRPDIEQTAPELLAHHYTQAGVFDQSVGYWLEAGKRAHERSANAEAIAHLTKGLRLLDKLPSSSDRMQRELTLLVTLGVPQQAINGPGSPEVEDTYNRARELCREIDHAPELLPVLWGLWRTQVARANIFAAKELADELLLVARRQKDSALVLQAHHAQWATLFDHGEYDDALEHLEQGIALYNRSEHHTQALLFGGHDPYVCAQGHAGLLLWTIGYPDQALERAHDSLRLADELSHPVTMAHALRYTAKAYLYRRDAQGVEKSADQLVALASEHNMVDSFALGTFMQGWALSQTGRHEDGVARMRQGLVAGRAAGRHEDESNLIAGLAQALEIGGAADEGCRILDKALAVGADRGMAYWDAELLRLKGDLLLSLSTENQTETESYYTQARAAARRRNAKSLELRATMSLARLWADAGRRAEAHDLLAPLYGWFTEGFDTLDLKDARALLDELS